MTDRSAGFNPTQHEIDVGPRQGDLVSSNEAHRVRDRTLGGSSAQHDRRPRLVSLEPMVAVDRSVVDQRVDERVAQAGQRRALRIPLELVAPGT